MGNVGMGTVSPVSMGISVGNVRMGAVGPISMGISMGVGMGA